MRCDNQPHCSYYQRESKKNISFHPLKRPEANLLCLFIFKVEKKYSKMSESDNLVEINRSELPQLRDLYLIDWPENMQGYYTVDNFIRWFEKKPIIKNLVLYCLNGDWSDGTFVAIVNNQFSTVSRSNSITIHFDFLGSLSNFSEYFEWIKWQIEENPRYAWLVTGLQSEHISR